MKNDLKASVSALATGHDKLPNAGSPSARRKLMQGDNWSVPRSLAWRQGSIRDPITGCIFIRKTRLRGDQKRCR